MFVTLSALCLGAFVTVCGDVASSETEPAVRPADFTPIENDVELKGKLEEMITGNVALCRRNYPDACVLVQSLSTMRSNLYSASQRCAQPQPQACDLYAEHRAFTIATYENFQSTASDRNRLLGQPTHADQLMKERLEEQKRRAEAFERRILEMDSAFDAFRQTIIGQ